MLKLLEKMKVDLELKGYSLNTVEAYLRYSKQFLDYYQKPIEQLHTDEISNYLHYLIVIKIGWSHQLLIQI